MKKQKEEYGIYQKTGKFMMYKGRYIYEYVLVKRGFYDGDDARREAFKVSENDASHIYRVLSIISTRFWEDFDGDVYVF